MKYIQGNLIELFKQSEFDVIAHQCNCFYLGAGIAKALVEKFPQIQTSRFLNQHEKFGNIEEYETEHGTIINLYSQFKGGICTEGIDCFEIRLATLSNCLKQVNRSHMYKRIGIPLLASGIAADQEKKGKDSDFEYFRKYIESTVKHRLYNMELTIVYL